MAVIVVAEDDGGTQKLISVVLKNQGHNVFCASDGLAAWRLALECAPDLIVSDVNMPGITGFELLQRVREHPRLSHVPLILLTSLQERRDMRQGMNLGANDYITKPLRPRELVEAVEAQIQRQAALAASVDQQVQQVLANALEQQAWDLHEEYEKRLARELSEQWPGDARGQQAKDYPQATVLFADIRGYADWLVALSPTEIAQLLKRFYENSGDTAYLFGASAMQFVGEGVIAIFAAEDGAAALSHSRRAAKSALGLRSAAASMADFAQSRFPGRTLPRFEVGIALHSGPVSMMRIDGLLGGTTHLVPVGETVIDALAMQRHARPGPSAITVSVPVLRAIWGEVRPVSRYLLPLPRHAEPMDVCTVEPLAS